MIDDAERSHKFKTEIPTLLDNIDNADRAICRSDSLCWVIAVLILVRRYGKERQPDSERETGSTPCSANTLKDGRSAARAHHQKAFPRQMLPRPLSSGTTTKLSPHSNQTSECESTCEPKQESELAWANLSARTSLLFSTNRRAGRVFNHRWRFDVPPQ